MPLVAAELGTALALSTVLDIDNVTSALQSKVARLTLMQQQDATASYDGIYPGMAEKIIRACLYASHDVGGVEALQIYRGRGPCKLINNNNFKALLHHGFK